MERVKKTQYFTGCPSATSLPKSIRPGMTVRIAVVDVLINVKLEICIAHRNP